MLVSGTAVETARPSDQGADAVHITPNNPRVFSSTSVTVLPTKLFCGSEQFRWPFLNAPFCVFFYIMAQTDTSSISPQFTKGGGAQQLAESHPAASF